MCRRNVGHSIKNRYEALLPRPLEGKKGRTSIKCDTSIDKAGGDLIK